MDYITSNKWWFEALAMKVYFYALHIWRAVNVGCTISWKILILDLLILITITIEESLSITMIQFCSLLVRKHVMSIYLKMQAAGEWSMKFQLKWRALVQSISMDSFIFSVSFFHWFVNRKSNRKFIEKCISRRGKCDHQSMHVQSYRMVISSSEAKSRSISTQFNSSKWFHYSFWWKWKFLHGDLGVKKFRRKWNSWI